MQKLPGLKVSRRCLQAVFVHSDCPYKPLFRNVLLYSWRSKSLVFTAFLAEAAELAFLPVSIRDSRLLESQTFAALAIGSLY